MFTNEYQQPLSVIKSKGNVDSQLCNHILSIWVISITHIS